MKVIAYNTHPNAPECVNLEEVYAKSDVISLHCPLKADNTGMINGGTIAKMKDGVILINTARRPLIVEEDLKQALLSGKVAYAALDVMKTEPIPADDVLLGVKNCIITPHFAWAPREARQRLMQITEDNLRAFVSGSPINVVN